MKKEMLINVAQPEECRIAILEDGVLQELYVERTSHESYVGNIYKGRIVNIEPSIQAAFVDFGVGRNGFLHVSDVEPTYYRHLEGGRDRGDRGDRGRDRDRNHGRDRGRDRDRSRQPAPVERDEASEPFAAEASPVEAPREELHAPEGFGAALFDFETVTEAPAMEPTPPEAPADVEAAPTAESPPLTAAPGTEIEEEPAKRRRSRGGSRRRRGAAKAEETPAEGEKTESASDEEAPPSQPMESAERRTTDRDDPTESAPGGAGGGMDDDDLFFFPPRPEPAAPARESAPEPVPPPETEWAPAPEAPPARPAPAPRGNVEDDLAADLAEWDRDEGGAATPIVEAEAEVETEFAPPAETDEEFDQRLAEDLDQALSPPPRERGRREERGRRDDRRGGGRRDDRRDDRRGGRRDDRRGGGRRDSRPGMGRDKPLIQDIFKRGQEVLVRVIKEGLGTKGPTLSTYLSIPGRYLVIMPHITGIRVSRKIEDDEHRRRLRELFGELKPPHGIGFILRTAAVDKNQKDLQRDLAYLSRLWQVMVRRVKKLKAPAEIYQESDMITRTIRDNFTADIDSVWIDDPAAYERAKEFCDIVMPRYASRLRQYDGKEPLFYKYGIEEEIHKIQQRKVPLPFGGSIVIEQTEAMVAIDVNSGNFRADRQDAEETAYQMNLQAAKEIARQLRLRDLTGIIVNDFIDMRSMAHRAGVERAFREALKRDRARSKILKTSAFGLIEMTRQRTRTSLKRSVYQDCPHCHGMAQVKTCESMSLDVVRLLQLAACREQVQSIEVRVAAGVADYLLNRKRREIARLEEDGARQIHIQGVAGAPAELLDFQCLDKNGNEVKMLPQEAPPRPRR